MEKVYVVVGQAGEYSDRTEWLVCAYADAALAQEHVEKATAWYMENVAGKYMSMSAPPCNPYDAHTHYCYCDDVRYLLVPTDLRKELPT